MPDDQTFSPALDRSTNGVTISDRASLSSNDVQPRPNEDETWRWLENAAEESIRVRKEEARFDEFSNYLDLYYGIHWPATLPTFRPPVVANELRTLILSEASDLTESQLRVFITKDPRHGQRDQQAEAAFRAVWAREQIDLQLMYAVTWALIVGTGFLEIGWDPDNHHGLGDVFVRSMDPRHVLPDPDAVDDRSWAFVIKDHVFDLHEIRRLFPLSGYRVKPEDRWSIKDTTSAPEAATHPSYMGPLSTSGNLLGGIIAGYKKARARVLDCVVLDPAIEERIVPMTLPDGTPIRDANGDEQLQQVIEPKYPHGRRIVGANHVILFDGPNPHPARGGNDHDFGVLRVCLEPPLGRFWGQGFVHQTAELQLAADKLLSNIVENAVRLNNGIVRATTNTGLDWETFAGIPAQVVQINPGSEFEIKYPPPMPPDMIEAPWRMLDLQRRLLGFQDARMGAPGRGNVSPELTETEIAQSQAPSRLRARMLYYTVQRLAEMIFARMAHGYIIPRAIPAVENETFEPIQWEPLADPDKYAVFVDPASFTLMSKTLLRRLGIALYRLKAIDRRSLLERLAWPDWQETSKRLDEAERLAAIAQIKKNRK